MTKSKMRVVRTAGLAALAASALVLSACSGSPSSSAGGDGAVAADGGHLTVVTSARGWEGLDPAASAVSTYRVMLFSIYDPLFKLDEKGEVVPWLVKEASSSDDGLEWTFELQDGVKFHDGTDFNAEAVKINLDRQTDTEKRSGEGGNLPRGAMSTEVVDDLTVKILLDDPVESLTSALASSVVGLMASPSAIEKYGEDYGLHPVGTGPFVFDDTAHIVGQSAHATKNEDYWVDGQPKLDEITFKQMDSAASGLQALRSGEAQMLDNAGPMQVDAIAGDSDFTGVFQPPVTVSQLYMNTKKAPFDDIRARQAITLAIDQQDLIDNLFYGIGAPASSPIGSGSWAFPGWVESYPKPDVEAAKKLVDEIGGLSFTGLFANTSEGAELGAAIQSQLARAGIKMEVSTPDQATRISDTFGGKFELVQFAVMGSADPDVLFRPWFDPSGANPSGIDDAELHSLLMEARTTPGNDARAAIYAKAAERVAKLSPTAYLAEVPLYKILSSDLVGFSMPPADAPYMGEVAFKK
ncbi:hypothetical protein E4J89_17175 [Arthrobacter sp. CAU 1506]|nr:hypothetical protein E4J89_17175 [Arthrobacter sp. CAU 1506]